MVKALAEELDREHREIDEEIAAFAAGQSQADRMRGAIRLLRRHIYLEEEFLFPPLQDAGMVAPVFVMLREHAQIWQTLDELEAALSANGDTAMLCKQLTVLLQHHNPKEERILYPQGDEVLTAAAKDQLIGLIEASEMPDGWICIRAR